MLNTLHFKVTAWDILPSSLRQTIKTVTLILNYLLFFTSFKTHCAFWHLRFLGLEFASSFFKLQTVDTVGIFKTDSFKINGKSNILGLKERPPISFS